MNDPTLSKKPKDIRSSVKNILALMLGVEPSDLHDEDSLVEDLHMGATDLTDLSERLEGANYNTANLHFNEIETVEDLIDFLSSEEEI